MLPISQLYFLIKIFEFDKQQFAKIKIHEQLTKYIICGKNSTRTSVILFFETKIGLNRNRTQLFQVKIALN
jgi:hypothetical protein